MVLEVGRKLGAFSSYHMAAVLCCAEKALAWWTCRKGILRKDMQSCFKRELTHISVLWTSLNWS